MTTPPTPTSTSRPPRRASGRHRSPVLLAAAVTLALVAALALGAVTATAPPAGAAAGPQPGLRVLSGRADTVTGGDALVRVSVPRGLDPRRLRVTLGGRDVTHQLLPAAGRVRSGLVRGLRLGRNRLVARVGDSTRTLVLANHRASGPVFSGPQVQPWQCATEAAGLGPATPGTCHARARVDWVYRSTLTQRFEPYDRSAPPADVATTTTDQGRTVPFVVRVETGTVNRAIQRTAVLADPRARTTRSRFAPWNGKAHVPFGGGCEPNHGQATTPDVLGSSGDQLGILDGSLNADLALARGFAVMSSSSNILAEQCNTVVAAETVMMLEEHLAETARRPVRYTIGQGCSGGSVQQFVTAAAQPGVLDGLIPMCSFPDLGQVTQEAVDCTLLNRVFNERSPEQWAVLAQRNAVQGYVSPTPCVPFYDGPTGFSRTWFDPANAEGCALPSARVYDARTNRDGVRCTLQDYAVSVFGRRASDGFANRPYDNVGVQYGLEAVESGVISVEQFLDLNAEVGGFDIDFGWQPARSVADRAGLRHAYRSGWTMSGPQLSRVPIIDLRGTDPVTNHTDVHSYSIRARLDRDSGHHANHVLWTGQPVLLNDPEANRSAFLLMDRWLARIEADRSSRPLAAKVVAAKPGTAVDACWVAGRKITDRSVCRAAFPWFGNARLAAGGPLTDDVLKCRLRPLSRSDYATDFTGPQWERMRAIFPSGTCDPERPGVEQQRTVPWLRYDRPGGTPMGGS